jgi:hypothetical protein
MQGFVDAAMMLPIGLFVASQAKLADCDTAVDSMLANGAGLPSRTEGFDLANTQRKQARC